MGVLHLLDHRDVVQLDVEVLVHALQRAAHGDVILELDGDLVVHQSLEEAVYRKHKPVSLCSSFVLTFIPKLPSAFARGEVPSGVIDCVRARGGQSVGAIVLRGSDVISPEEQHSGVV